MTTYLCPKGHQSQAGDYCDECGAVIGAPSVAAAAANAPAAPAGAMCPECDTPQAGRFCEVCGYDFIVAKLGGGSLSESAPDPVSVAAPAAPAVPAAPAYQAAPAEQAAPVDAARLPQRTPANAGWVLVVDADADYHARMQAQAEPDAEPIDLPQYVPPRRFVLNGTRVLIGRRSRSRGIEPEIDLSGPPADSAVSHAHALLLAGPDGAWAVVDLESANGTYVNDGVDPIPPNAPCQLADGDRIHVGAWTTITLGHPTAAASPS